MSAKIKEGLMSVERIKLLIGYSLNETLSENIQNILVEQPTGGKPLMNNPIVQRDNTVVNTPIIPRKPITKPTPRKTYQQTKSLTVSGPYTKNNLPYLNKKIIVNKGSIGEAYYILKNNSNKEVKITSISSTSQEGKIVPVFSPKSIAPNKSTKIYITIYDEVRKNTVDNKPAYGVVQRDNTYVKQFIKTPSQQPSSKETSSTLTIRTNIGNLSFKINFDYSESLKQQLKAIENFNKGLSIPGGKKVEGGFSPFEYDEYLAKVKLLAQRCPNIKSRIIEQPDSKFDRMWDTPQRREEINKISKCNEEYKNLRSQYVNEKFPKGITREDLVDFKKEKNEIEKQIKKFEQSHMVMSMREPYDMKFDQSSLSPSDKQKYQQLLKMRDSTFSKYGYDQRNSFDKFMDSGWGQLAQFGALGLLVIAGFFTEGATWVTAADLLLNLGLGSYYTARGNVREGLIWFIFAGMGQLHGIYNYLSSSVGRKLAGQSLESVSKSIANKLVGVNLNSQAALNSFMYGVLNKQERIVFRSLLDTLKKNPKVVENSLEGFAKEIAKGRNVYRDISLFDAMKFKPSAGKFIKNTFIDLAVTIPLVQKGYDELKSLLKNKGVDITWGERDNKILDYISENKTPSEIKNFFINETKIVNSLTQKELKYYENEQKKLNEQEFKNEIDKKIKMSDLQTEQYIKQIQEKIKKIDADQEARKQSLLSPIEKQKKMDQLNQMFNKQTTVTSVDSTSTK